MSLEAAAITNSAEFEPEWVPTDAIPYYKMPVDDPVWYPPMLDGKVLGGRFAFDGVTLVGCAMWELEDWQRRLLPGGGGSSS